MDAESSLALSKSRTKSRWLAKKLNAFGRLLLMVTVTLTVYPILIFFPWRIVFGVNAGSHNDTKNYSPDFLAKIFKWGIFWPIGFIRMPHGWGLTVGAQFSNEEILRDRNLIKRLLWWMSNFRFTKRIALNGVIPASAEKHNVFPVDDVRFVRTQLGTLFMITENIKQAQSLHPHIKDMPIAVVGCGYTGRHLVEYLADDLGKDVIAFDTGLKPAKFENAVFAAGDFSKIKTCGAVIILTTQGNSGIDSIIEHLCPHSVVISDTHPKITRSRWRELNKKVAGCYESATVYPGCWFFPSFPRWNKTTVPGCVVQAIVEGVCDRAFDEQAEFNLHALDVGFVARLDVPEGLDETV